MAAEREIVGGEMAKLDVDVDADAVELDAKVLPRVLRQSRPPRRRRANVVVERTL